MLGNLFYLIKIQWLQNLRHLNICQGLGKAFDCVLFLKVLEKRKKILKKIILLYLIILRKTFIENQEL